MINFSMGGVQYTSTYLFENPQSNDLTSALYLSNGVISKKIELVQNHWESF